jgi:hypothetical protein
MMFAVMSRELNLDELVERERGFPQIADLRKPSHVADTVVRSSRGNRRRGRGLPGG